LQAQIDKIEAQWKNEKKQKNLKILNTLRFNYTNSWKQLFEFANLGDLDAPLTP
jgi:hypothetical protein